VSRSDTERLRDIVECIDAIYRAELTVQRYPDDDDVAQVALDAVKRRVLTIGEGRLRPCRRVCASATRTSRGPTSHACAT
jgi:uncharacterized protein with HEPN domain